MRASSVRAVLLFILFVALASSFVLFLPRGQSIDPRLAWIATAHQFGPVGYRDPAGAISPDGRWIAYSEGRFLRVKPIDGGPIVDLPAGPAQIRYIAWRSDSRAVASDGDPSIGGYAIYDIVARSRGPLFVQAPAGIRQPAWSSDGTSIAALVNGQEGNELWRFPANSDASPVDSSRGERVRTLSGAASFPAWTSTGEIACVINANGQSRVTVPCGGATVHTNPDLDAYGPIAFSADGGMMYVALASDRGTVDLWAAPMTGRRGRRLSSFARDAYGPSVAADGSVLFKVQSYRTAVAMVAVGGGPAEAGRPVPATPLSTFQSETPSWDPTGRWLGITYGTWRRIPDDAKYPDIAQDAGIIGVDPAKPATAPARVVHESVSEDQSLCWSPNGKWIAFHSHKEQSDDIWLRSAEGSEAPRRISFLGRGAETGWPRWSPDGQWLLFDGANKARESVFFVIGIDQETGTTKGDAQEIAVRGLDADMSHAEWLPDSLHVAAIAKEAPGRHAIFTVSREGGDAQIVHRFSTEHDAPGLAVSPDGAAVAFIAPAPDGFFQLFRMPLSGGSAAPTQVTTDPTNKTQPAWSPDGKRIALTVWNYDAEFFRLVVRDR